MKTMNIQTIKNDVYEIENIIENKQFPGFFDGFIGTMSVQYDSKPSTKGLFDIVFMGVSYAYTKFKIIK